MEPMSISEAPGEVVLSGRMLRYVCTTVIFERGPCTVARLAAAISSQGFTVSGRPSKTISDALRWEIAHGRIVRLDRSRYGPGVIPRSTRHRIDRHVGALRAQARNHTRRIVA